MTGSNNTKIQNIKEIIDKINQIQKNQETVSITDYMNLIANCCLVFLSHRYRVQIEHSDLQDLHQNKHDFEAIVNHLCDQCFINVINTKTNESALFNIFMLLPGGTLIFHKELTIHARAILQIPESYQTEVINYANLNIDKQEALKKTLKDDYRITFNAYIKDAEKKLKDVGLFKDNMGIFSSLKSHDICDLYKLLITDINGNSNACDIKRVKFYLAMAKDMECKNVDEFRYVVEFTKSKLSSEVTMRVKKNNDKKSGTKKSKRDHYRSEIVKDIQWHKTVIDELVSYKPKIEPINNQSTIKFVHWLTAAYHYEKHASGMFMPNDNTIAKYFEEARKITACTTQNVKWSQDGSLKIYEYRQGDWLAITHKRLNDDKTYISTFYNTKSDTFKKFVYLQKLI